MKGYKHIVISLTGIALSCAIYANDTAGTTAGGGITFNKSPDIVLEREELKVSPTEITVAYLFENKSKQDIETQVFFPLPPFKPQGANSTWDTEINPKANADSSPFLNFSVSVQGQPVQFTTVQQATLNGEDITQKLQTAKIPLNPEFTAGNIPLPDSDKVQRWQTQAKELGLLDENNKPKWKKQTIYYWTQTFPANQQILVEHHYRPATGMMYAAMDPTQDTDKAITDTFSRLNQTFNVKVDNLQTNSKNLKNWLTDQIKNNSTNTSGIYAYFYNIDYILKTGANWAGPIKNFTLTIMKPTHGMVTFNRFFPKENVRIEDQDDRKIIFIRNFVPQQNLQVLYATSAPLNPQNKGN